MTTSLEPPFGGYAWTMSDARKLDDRIMHVIRRNLGVTGEIPHATDEQMAAAEARAAMEWRETRTRVLLSRLPAGYRDAEPRTQGGLSWLTAYLSGARNNLIVAGPTGTGKTWEAAAIARQLLVDHTIPTTMVNMPELLDALRPDREGRSDLHSLQVAPVLIIDDLGSEKHTEWTDEQLFRLTDYRRGARLPMIVTTNFHSDELEQRYGPRIMRRISEEARVLRIPKRLPQASQRQEW